MSSELSTKYHSMKWDHEEATQVKMADHDPTSTGLKLQLREEVADTRFELKRLDHEISYLHSRLSILLGQRYGCASRLDGLENASLPQKRLPSEILIQIFHHCTTDPIRIPLESTSSMPWVLGHVCSHWRRLVLDEPLLWNYILIEDSREGNIMQPLRQVLCKSGQSKLDFAVSAPNLTRAFPMDGFLYRHFIAVMKTYGHRMWSISLDFAPVAWEQDFMRQFLSLPAGTFVSLEEIFLFGKAPSLEGHALEGAPRLRTALIRGKKPTFPSLSFPGTLHLPWSRLINLQIIDAGILPGIAHAILNECSQLSTCTIYLAREGQQVIPQPEPFTTSSIILPVLKTFNVCVLLGDLTSGDLPARFFRPFVLPSLLDLGIATSYRVKWPQSSAEPLLTSLHDSACPIRCLSVGNINLDLGQVFRQLPTIMTCKTSQSWLTTSTIRAMIEEDAAPYLETLECMIRPDDLDEFVEMLEGRWLRPIQNIFGPDGSVLWERKHLCDINARVFLAAGADNDMLDVYRGRLAAAAEKSGLRNARIIFGFAN